MANTFRKTTAVTDFVREPFHSSLSYEPTDLTVNNLACQARGVLPGAVHSFVPCIADAVTKALYSHRHDGGSTVSVSAGIMSGLARFAVSIYPERTVEVSIEPSWELFFSYAIISADLLLQPHHALGTWFDAERNLHVLDIVICPISLNEALELSMRHGQKAIYDLGVGREIRIGTHPDGERV